MYNKNRHPLLQEHIIIHESAHLFLNHRLRKITLPTRVDESEGILKQSSVRFRSHLIFRDLELDMDGVDYQQEEEAETFARLFMALVHQHKRHQDLVSTQNVNLFPPFSDER